MKDRTNKVLLGLIAAGLWANLARPLLQPTPSQAQVGEATVTHSVLRARRLEIVNSKGKVTAYIEPDVAYSQDQRRGAALHILDERGVDAGSDQGVDAVRIDTEGIQINEKNGLSAMSFQHYTNGSSFITIDRADPKQPPGQDLSWLRMGHSPSEGSWFAMQGRDGKTRIEMDVDAKDKSSLTSTSPDGKKNRVLKP